MQHDDSRDLHALVCGYELVIRQDLSDLLIAIRLRRRIDDEPFCLAEVQCLMNPVGQDVLYSPDTRILSEVRDAGRLAVLRAQFGETAAQRAARLTLSTTCVPP